MATYRQIKQQIAELEKKAAVAMKTEVPKVIEAITKQIAEFGLSAADLGLRPARGVAGRATRRGKKGVSPPKYRDPETGRTWTGIGKRPGWFVAAQEKGRVNQLLIAPARKAAPQAKAAKKTKVGSTKKSAPQGKAAAKSSIKKSGKKAASATKPAARKAAKTLSGRAQKKPAVAAKAAVGKPAAKKAAKPVKRASVAAAAPAPAASPEAVTEGT